jgi:hypothetical protein
MVASFNSEARIAQGPGNGPRHRRIVCYMKTLSPCLEVTGNSSRMRLEHSAKYFKAYVPGKPATDLVDEKNPCLQFRHRGRVNYDLDISKPVGQRN